MRISASGAPSPGTAFQEYTSPAGGTITGARNGANKVYTLSHAPALAALLSLYIDGVLVDPNLYALVGAVVTLGASVSAPSITQSIVADYFY